MKLEIVLDENATMPRKEHVTDAALDIFASEDTIVGPDHTTIVPTGVKMAIPYGYVGWLHSRSGLTVKSNLRIHTGVIDSGYRGEVGIMTQTENGSYEVKKGDKIAQLVITPIPEVNAVEVSYLDEADRGENGFGSSGI
jgi:dUTP pyrophosphatase